jgi:hypothetical protein
LNKYIVTTTISKPTEASLKYLKKTDWYMIIVGDQKTPHDDYLKLEKQFSNLHYMSPEEQEKNYKKLSDNIGWNKIMRRNIGFCYAYTAGADIIASIDDDNIPYEDWGNNIYVNNTITIDCWKSENGVFDPLSVTCSNYLWHRGYPSELIPTRNKIKYMGKIKRKVLIQADLWDGVPDIDAINRIIYNPRIKLNITEPFCSSEIAPFNSQNTFLAREIVPHYMVFPYIGRMDDIWASYMIQKKFPESVIFNKPTVYQERYEPHTRNIKDLKDGIIGYEFTLKFINNEFSLPENSQKAYNIYQSYFKK